MIMTPQDNDKSMNALVHDALYGVITPEKFQQLDELIIEQPDIVDEYLDFIELYSLLQQKAESDQSDAKMNVEQWYREILELNEKQELQKSQIEYQSRKKQIEEMANTQLNQYLAQQNRDIAVANQDSNAVSIPLQTFKITVIAMAACLMFSACLWWYFQVRHPVQVATIIDSYQAQWDAEPGSTLENQEYHLIGGLAEIEFNDGAKIILEGPAEIKFESANGAELKSGKLIANVPLQASGFIINTPSAKFVDRGTSFGVAVTSESSTLSVFEGEVAIALVGSNPENYKNVYAGQSKRTFVGSDQIDTLSSPIHFVKAIPAMDEVMSDSQANFVRSGCQTPTLYLALNSKAQLDEDSRVKWRGEFNLTDGPALENDLNNHAILFDGKTTWLEFSLNKAKDWGEGFTWAMWIKPAQLHKLCVFKVGSFDDTFVFQSLHIDIDEKQQPFLDYKFRVAEEMNIEKNSGHQLIAPVLLNETQQWIHVAGTMNENRVRLYKNGELVGQYDIGLNKSVLGDTTDIFVLGKPIMSSKKELFSEFQGSLDEVLLYSCELTQRDVEYIFLKKMK